jgi:hypothetical protein
MNDKKVQQSHRSKRHTVKRRGLSAWGRIKLAVAILLIGGAIDTVGSSWTAPGIVWTSRDRTKRFQLDGGGFSLCIGFGHPLSLDWALHGNASEHGADIAGIVVRKRVRDWNQSIITERWWFLGLPWWLIAVPFFVKKLDRYLGTLGRRGLARQWQAARRRRNLCPGCGYDVRASPERCPECGRHLPPYWLRTNMSKYR